MADSRRYHCNPSDDADRIVVGEIGERPEPIPARALAQARSAAAINVSVRATSESVAARRRGLGVVLQPVLVMSRATVQCATPDRSRRRRRPERNRGYSVVDNGPEMPRMRWRID